MAFCPAAQVARGFGWLLKWQFRMKEAPAEPDDEDVRLPHSLLVPIEEGKACNIAFLIRASSADVDRMIFFFKLADRWL